MSLQRFVLILGIAPIVGLATCREPEPLKVEAGDAVRCCFLVPYDGLAGTEQEEQCLPQPVCAGPDHEDTEDVCKPLACESGDETPYGRPGPSGNEEVSGNCTFDVRRTTVQHGACGDHG